MVEQMTCPKIREIPNVRMTGWKNDAIFVGIWGYLIRETQEIPLVPAISTQAHHRFKFLSASLDLELSAVSCHQLSSAVISCHSVQLQTWNQWKYPLEISIVNILEIHDDNTISQCE